MKLCNYNWNISTLKLLQKSRIYTTELNINIHRGTENFAIGMEDEYNIWIEREYEKKNEGGDFRYAFIDITIKMSDGFAAHYFFDNQYNIIKMFFHSKGWWI